jgi:hypothetical protein
VTCAALLLIFIIWVAIIGWLGGGIQFPVSRLVFESLFIGFSSYAIAVTVHTLAATQRDVLALAPALTLDERRLAHKAATITHQSSAIHIWTVGWMLTIIVLTWWTSRMAIDDNALVNELTQPAIAGWDYCRNLIYVFTVSQLTWIEIALARRLGKVLEEHGRVNLLDRSSLRPLAKRTKRSVLIWLPLVGHSLNFLVVLLAVVILPATGIRRRYIKEKALQLEKVRARIADRSTAVIDGSVTSESSNLPELVSWEQRLQQAKVWPYDMTAYLRVFLYASIGLASWIGAALVERFVGAFIG